MSLAAAAKLLCFSMRYQDLIGILTSVSCMTSRVELKSQILVHYYLVIQSSLLVRDLKHSGVSEPKAWALNKRMSITASEHHNWLEVLSNFEQKIKNQISYFSCTEEMQSPPNLKLVAPRLLEVLEDRGRGSPAFSEFRQKILEGIWIPQRLCVSLLTFVKLPRTRSKQHLITFCLYIFPAAGPSNTSYESNFFQSCHL